MVGRGSSAERTLQEVEYPLLEENRIPRLRSLFAVLPVTAPQTHLSQWNMGNTKTSMAVR